MIKILTQPALAALPHIGHAFFTRQGGLSQGDHAGLSVGTRGNNEGYVEQNIALAAKSLGLDPARLVLPLQIHIPQVQEVRTPFPLIPLDARPQVDALWTGEKRLGVSINTADCVPLLIAHKTRPLVAAAHAGWKGALSGIVEATLGVLVSQGHSPQEFVAVLGPCIAQKSYEVGGNVRAPFVEKDPINERFFIPNPLHQNHFFFDLPGYVVHLLTQAKVGHVSAPPWNTYDDPEQFFSCRRAFHEQRPSFGCLLSTIWIR
jgi:polyphenol oxidase